MFRFTTLVALAIFALTTAVLTGCDSGKTGSQANKPNAPPSSGEEKKLETPGKVAEPPK